MRDRRFTPTPAVVSSAISLFVFYIYFRPYWLLGVIFSAGLGISSYTLLNTWKVHKVRLLFITAFTLVTWIGALGLLAQMNPDSFIRYLTSHLTAYEFKLFKLDYEHIPFVRQLPNTLGSTILMQLSLPWVGLTIPHPVERLLFLLFPFHYPPITLGMFIFVLIPHLALVLAFGRGWCGWVCYFGNQTESIASRGKERWRLPRLRERFRTSDGRELLDCLRREVRYIKYIFMGALLLPSFLLGINTICTLGLIFNFQYPLGASLIVLMLLLTGLILPIQTRKRWWCLVCPAGAGIALVDTITPFKIGIDPSKCDRCYACATVCPMHAISPRILGGEDKPNLDCVKCCRCIEVCSRGAIDVYIRGTKRRVRGLFVPLMMVVAASWYVWFAVSAAELFTLLG